VPEITRPPKSSFIADKLNRHDDDVIYCTIGMIHRYKGVIDAIKALTFLPERYKLAIIGGMHPLSDDVPVYNQACDLIDKLGLHDRVYITGFVKDDDEMNSYIQECDISVFPYNGSYYAHVSSGAINLALANDVPTIAYPTDGFKEIASNSNGALVLADTYAYYELARELQRIDIEKQRRLIKAYAKEYSWPKMAGNLVEAYKQVV
jgi:glycosyltransferase involved in cell wall biosynthesis